MNQKLIDQLLKLAALIKGEATDTEKSKVLSAIAETNTNRDIIYFFAQELKNGQIKSGVIQKMQEIIDLTETQKELAEQEAETLTRQRNKLFADYKKKEKEIKKINELLKFSIEETEQVIQERNEIEQEREKQESKAQTLEEENKRLQQLIRNVEKGMELYKIKQLPPPPR